MVKDVCCALEITRSGIIQPKGRRIREAKLPEVMDLAFLDKIKVEIGVLY